jgi:hypothetical protein
VLLVAAVSLGKSGPVTDNLQFAVDSSGTGPPPPPPPPPPAPPADTTPPAFTALRGNKIVSVQGRARFNFAASETSTYMCRVDGRPFRPCTSPFAAPRLGAGHHTFSVQAFDAAGNPSTVSEVGFRVKKPKPKHHRRTHHR